MTNCQTCNKNFPDDLLQKLASNATGELTYTLMCPICGLEEMRKIAGKSYMFTGPMALSL